MLLFLYSLVISLFQFWLFLNLRFSLNVIHYSWFQVISSDFSCFISLSLIVAPFNSIFPSLLLTASFSFFAKINHRKLEYNPMFIQRGYSFPAIHQIPLEIVKNSFKIRVFCPGKNAQSLLHVFWQSIL